MKRYIVFYCYYCPRILVADRRYKSRVCPHCGNRNYLDRVLLIASFDNHREATYFAQFIKMRKVNRDHYYKNERSY